MTEFDYVCLFLAIPIGLALTELGQGISLALRRRHEVAIGWLTPLLLFFILLLIAIVLESLWGIRETINVSAQIIFIGLFASLAFYVTASFVFPDRLDGGMALDDWFMRNRRFSLGGTALIVLVFFFVRVANQSLTAVEYPVIAVFVAFGMFSLFFAPVIVALRTRELGTARMAMFVLNAVYLLIFLWSALR